MDGVISDRTTNVSNSNPSPIVVPIWPIMIRSLVKDPGLQFMIQLTVDGGPVHSGIGRPTSPAKLCTIDAAASEPVAIAKATCGICVAMVSPAAKTPGTVVRQSASTAMGLAAAGVGSPNPTPSCSTNCDR
jgi:hypothetical protein